jgi:hypothetical protein
MVTLRLFSGRTYDVHESDEPVSRRPRLESVSDKARYLRPLPHGTGTALLWPVSDDAEESEYGTAPDFVEVFYVGWRNLGR